MSPSMKNLVGLRLTGLPADSQRERKKAMSMKTGVSSCLLTLALGSAHFASPAMAQESAKWFVLRHDQTGSCWTALLISINGDYRHAFAQKAGGPYDSKAEALKREKELETKGVCPKD